MQRAVNLAAKKAEQQRAAVEFTRYPRIAVIASGQKWALTTVKVKPASTALVSIMPIAVELQLFLHQRGTVAPVRDATKANEGVRISGARIGLFSTLAMVSPAGTPAQSERSQPNVQPVERGQLQLANLLALNNRVGDREVGTAYRPAR